MNYMEVVILQRGGVQYNMFEQSAEVITAPVEPPPPQMEAPPTHLSAKLQPGRVI